MRANFGRVLLARFVARLSKAEDSLHLPPSLADGSSERIAPFEPYISSRVFEIRRDAEEAVNVACAPFANSSSVVEASSDWYLCTRFPSWPRCV